MSDVYDFTIESLGKRNIKSPIPMGTTKGNLIANYVTDDEYVRLDTSVKPGAQTRIKKTRILECAGPREMIYFTPAHVHAGILA